MSDESTHREIMFSVDIEARPEDVWQKLTDPHEIPKWSYMERCELSELKVGGSYRFIDPPGPDDIGRIVVMEPNQRLVYEWTSSEPEPTYMEYLLEDRGGSTRLTVRNSPFKKGGQWDQFYEQNFKGWLDFTLQLKALVEGREAASVATSTLDDPNCV